LTRSLDEVLESIGTMLKPAGESHPEEPEAEDDHYLDLEKAGGLMTELMGLLQEGDASAEECLEALRASIIGSRFREGVEKLKDQIERYDFEDAQNTLMQLAKSLNIPLEDAHAGKG
ncbi:hypothetical protein KKG22_06125, partial [Patescibacteria group bacterium]|nr:hypothetical protein [Patescibacteria group bacterium]